MSAAEPEVDTEPIAMLCLHENPAKTLQVRFACADDYPIYPGDSVVTRTTWGVSSRGSIEGVDKVTIERADA